MHGKKQWTEVLHTVHLGILSVIHEDANAPLAEIVHGTGIRLPG